MSDQFPSLSDILAAHSIRQDYNHPAWGKCRCGFDPDPGWDDDAMTDEEINSWPSQSQHQADMWREACTVTTVEQLDAPPDGCVVRDQRGLLWETDQGHMYAASYAMPMCIKTVALPAVIVWHPEWETR